MADQLSGGFFLSLLTESFVVRALLGSLAAVAGTALLLRSGRVRTGGARRILVLAPAAVVATVGVASVLAAEAYLPQLWMATPAGSSTAAQLLELVGDFRGISTEAGVNLLVLGYAAVVAVLLARRAVGLWSVGRLLRAGSLAGHGALVPLVGRLAAGMGVAAPKVVVLPSCPGGAFTAGLLRPVLAIDRALLDALDDREVEGLLAHELAHIARRDTRLAFALGVLRDLTFFLPTMSVANRLVRQEREEGADELASARTGRPVALASSILKVYDHGCARRVPQAACAIVGARRPLALAGGGTSADARVVAARVERLIDSGPAAGPGRRVIELAVGVVVLSAALVAGLVLPSYVADELDAYSLSFGYLRPPEVVAEAPAFATFRALTAPVAEGAPTVPAIATGRSPVGVQGPALTSESPCPCIATRAQLRDGADVAERGPGGMLWGRSHADAWKLDTALDRTAVRARPLWALTDTGPQLGVFLVARPEVP